MRADSYEDHRRDSQRQQSEAQLRTAAVKRREAFTRANVGLSRAIGTTIIVSPLDMAGQPGACIVTAVLQAGLAIVDTTAHGEAEIRAPGGVQQSAQAPPPSPLSQPTPLSITHDIETIQRLAFCGAMPLTVK